jgi:hypothetical protein
MNDQTTQKSGRTARAKRVYRCSHSSRRPNHYPLILLPTPPTVKGDTLHPPNLKESPTFSAKDRSDLFSRVVAPDPPNGNRGNKSLRSLR